MRWKLIKMNGIIYNHSRSFSYKKVLSWYSNLYKPEPVKPPHNHLIQIGDPRLRTVSETIRIEEIETEKVQRLIKHLKSVFNRYNCLGLAATQIGVPLRIFMFGLDEKRLEQFTTNERKRKEVALMEPTVVINPEMKIVDFKTVTLEESCGSVKGFLANVPRYYSVSLRGFNEFAEPLQINASGFSARIIQHEMDHLDGKLYTDIMDRKSLTCSCWEVINDRNGKVELPYGPA